MYAGPYETYDGSPMSKGLLQHDLWGVKAPSQRWDWQSLRDKIAQHGVRNSLLLAPMPTASTSQVSKSSLKTSPVEALRDQLSTAQCLGLDSGIHI